MRRIKRENVGPNSLANLKFYYFCGKISRFIVLTNT